MPVDEEMKWVKTENLSTAPIDNEIVILNLARNSYFALDDVGARIWSFLEAPISAAELCQELRREFDVDEVRCLADINTFLAALETQGLIHAV